METTVGAINSGSRKKPRKVSQREQEKRQRNFFLAVFGITKNRLTGIHKVITKRSIPKEKRGGDRYANKNCEKKQKIREFLQALPASESHYNRSKSCRVYVSCELNINKLVEMYNSQNPNLRSSKSKFKRIFYNEFNIGFSSPASDACGTCLNLRNVIKEGGKNKTTLMTELRDWNLYNVKELSEAYMKVTAIKDLKRIFIRKFSSSKGCIIKYRGCSFFRFENVTQQNYLPFLKRGRKEGQLEELLIGKPIPLEKKKNVKALLEKQFNNADMQWQNLPSLEFFKPILDEGSKEAEQEYVEENEPIDDEACDCLEDDLELHL
nr:unnamed protein product [Callosobruchus chinensis]